MANDTIFALIIATAFGYIIAEFLIKSKDEWKEIDRYVEDEMIFTKYKNNRTGITKINIKPIENYKKEK